MHGDSPAAGNETENGIARHGLAALGELCHHIGAAFHQDARARCRVFGVLGAGVLNLRKGRARGQGVDGIVLVAEHGNQLVGHVLSRYVARADGGIQRIDVGIVQLLRYLLHGAGSKQAVHGQATTLDLGSQGIAAGFQVFFAAFLSKPLPHLCLGSSRHEEVLPIAGRTGVGIL